MHWKHTFNGVFVLFVKHFEDKLFPYIVLGPTSFSSSPFSSALLSSSSESSSSGSKSQSFLWFLIKESFSLFWDKQVAH